MASKIKLFFILSRTFFLLSLSFSLSIRLNFEFVSKFTYFHRIADSIEINSVFLYKMYAFGFNFVEKFKIENLFVELKK